jgi:transposase
MKVHAAGRPPADRRLILDGVVWIARNRVPWRDLHEQNGKWSSAYRQFRRWTLAGI